jgi:hypothetical protein
MGFVGGRPTAAAEADVLEEGEARSDIKAAPPPAPRRQLAVKKYSSTEELKSAAADLRYSVERRNADGSYSEALGTEVFGLNDPIRLTIEAGASGRLQVLELTAAGASRILFSAPAVRGTRYTVPAEGNLPPPKSPGPRRLRLVLSTESRPRYSVGTTARGAEATADITAEVTLLYR